MSIETKFDIPFVAGLALREKQIQQNYRPIIAVHKWFARRPGTLFRALTLCEFGDAPLQDLYFRPNEFSGRNIADPFMGGGTPLLEANRVGCDVTGTDINPMSAWIVREEFDHLDLAAYQDEASHLLRGLRAEIESFYLTDCDIYGDTDVPVKYFLWVKTIDCGNCGRSVDLFPSYILSKDSRHPTNVLVCSSCGELNEAAHLESPGACRRCANKLSVEGPARRNRCACPSCGHLNRYPVAKDGPPDHRLFAIEYFNPERKSEHKGRFFKRPDEKDLARLATSARRWQATEARFVPDQPIPPGDETDRLHRWGYTHYRQMFNHRQLLGLETSSRLIVNVKDVRIRRALATNLSDLLRYQNMLCRYDTWALKSLDIFSVHGFPVGLVQCESNLLGIVDARGANVGSGSWTNMVDKYAKAKRYCGEPFEFRTNGSRHSQVPIVGESIGTGLNGGRRRKITVRCGDSATAHLESNSLDAVFTDPPYFGNVQYGELMDFCYVWLRRLVGSKSRGFKRPSTRSAQELTGNVTQSRGLDHFTQGLSAVYSRMAEALKPGAPLVFTYHHNKLEAYCAVGVAILDAGLTCSASLPCPAEMGGSIHIRGTSSSIIDTVFVCRDQGQTSRQWLFESTAELSAIVASDLVQISMSGHKPTRGDARCVAFGHLTRMAIWNLRERWDTVVSTNEKLARFAEEMNAFGDLNRLLGRMEEFERLSDWRDETRSYTQLESRILDAVTF